MDSAVGMSAGVSGLGLKRNRKEGWCVATWVLMALAVANAISTDKLRSYGAAKREIMPGVSSIARVDISTMAVRMHTARRVNASVVCKGLNRPAMRSGFCLFLDLFFSISNRDGI